MRKIKEMADVSVPKGFTVEDGKSVCRDEYKQKMERNLRVTGNDVELNMFEPYSEAKEPEGGFIQRNNVRERL